MAAPFSDLLRAPTGNVAVSGLLLEAFAAMDLRWPAPDYDVEAEKARLRAAG